MLAKILDYLRYPSTWQGIAKVVGVVLAWFNYTVSPELAAAFAAAGLALSGFISMFFSDVDVKPKA